MSSAANTKKARGAVRPGANWAGWLGYAPAARSPEARRARADEERAARRRAYAEVLGDLDRLERAAAEP